jgi:hypothetical protein
MGFSRLVPIFDLSSKFLIMHLLVPVCSQFHHTHHTPRNSLTASNATSRHTDDRCYNLLLSQSTVSFHCTAVTVDIELKRKIIKHIKSSYLKLVEFEVATPYTSFRSVKIYTNYTNLYLFYTNISSYNTIF